MARLGTLENLAHVGSGAAHGWGVWPLFNYVERPGVSREEFYLWPLGYNVTRQPSPAASASGFSNVLSNRLVSSFLNRFSLFSA